MCIRDRYQRRVRGSGGASRRLGMEAKIKEQVGDRDPEFVFHLILDSTKCQKVEGLEQFGNLEVLSMNSCILTSLNGFPKLPQLKELSMADNKLAGADLQVLQGSDLKQLARLVLAGNSNIKELTDLTPLESIPCLRSLDLFECEVSKNPEYREKVFGKLGSLVYLDGTDRDGNEEDDEEEEDEDELDDVEGIESIDEEEDSFDSEDGYEFSDEEEQGGKRKREEETEEEEDDE
eukprot:TRINITY_DN8201_c0_g1_i1.p1 TRINITY_DN8201_c0_g1~~TRINITY_DN8201_c0_g1_i1.p1  ORF type:complete len:234 (-),score=94.31 TRINITY_DN8201_c0_g1_i1:108-809(-)